MYYVRKLSNLPNLEKIKYSTNIEDISSDILKQELGTTAGTLSFWKCCDISDLSDTAKAILLSTNAIKTSQFYILDDEIIKKYGLHMDDSELGQTGYKGFEYLHSNMVELTYKKLGAVLRMLNEVFNYPDRTPKYDKDKVKSFIAEVKRAGLLNEEVLQNDLKSDIDKYIR